MDEKLACEWEDQVARMLHLCEELRESLSRADATVAVSASLLREAEALCASIRRTGVRTRRSALREGPRRRIV